MIVKMIEWGSGTARGRQFRRGKKKDFRTVDGKNNEKGPVIQQIINRPGGVISQEVRKKAKGWGFESDWGA